VGRLSLQTDHNRDALASPRSSADKPVCGSERSRPNFVYWLVPAVMLAIVAALIDAWVLLIEIVR